MRSATALLPLLFTTSLPAQTTQAVADGTSAPRVLLYYDMEGLSGVDRISQIVFHGKDYAEGRKLLTEDVNAAIRGLKAGGAGGIVVTDSHGSLNPEPDILLDEMDRRASFEYRRERFDPYRDSPNAGFQAIVCIGMHARSNTPGFLAHTMTRAISLRVNGTDFSETTIIALSAMRFGVPVIMVSGDNVLQGQIKEQFPAAEYALVKRARGPAEAALLPLADARRNIERAAEEAIRRIGDIKPLAVRGPYDFEVAFESEENAESAAFYAEGTRVEGRVVKFNSPDFIRGYNQTRLLMSSVFSGNLVGFLFERVQACPDGPRIIGDLDRFVFLGPGDSSNRTSGRESGGKAPAEKQGFGGVK